MNLDLHTRARLISLRRWLLVLAAGALVWTVYLHLEGGFTVRLGSFRVSSHNLRTPLLLALVSLIPAGLLSWLLGDLRRPTVAEMVANGPAAALTAVAIVAVVVDFHQLFGAAPLWLDEEMIALNFRDRSFSQLGGQLWLDQSAPYGWLALQRAMLLTLGASEPALRLVPTLFGIATYVVALRIARWWLTWPAGLAFVLLCIFSHRFSHYRVEVKHYTADACFALLLPALAVWASEGADAAERRHRTLVWWTSAAIALWLANGAIFVAPVCALFLVAAMAHRDGVRAAARAAASGLLWLVSFALHYLISIQYTAHLRNYWADRFPPSGAGPLQAVQWFAERADPIAIDVGDSDAGMMLWALAALGFAWSARPALGLVYAGVVLSAFVLAALRLVPLFDRFSIWVLPALYAGLALLIDRAYRSGRNAARQRLWLRAGVIIVMASATLFVCAGILQRGAGRFHMVPPTSKQGMDDRTAVRWLMRHRQAGDAMMSTPLGLPALWWYGGISIAGEPWHASQPMYQAVADPGGPECGLPDELKQHPRLLVYLGFPDMREGFDELLLRELDRIGTIIAFQEPAPSSRAAVVDLRFDGPNVQTFTNRDARAPLGGCVRIRPAVRR